MDDLDPVFSSSHGRGSSNVTDFLGRGSTIADDKKMDRIPVSKASNLLTSACSGLEDGNGRRSTSWSSSPTLEVRLSPHFHRRSSNEHDIATHTIYTTDEATLNKNSNNNNTNTKSWVLAEAINTQSRRVGVGRESREAQGLQEVKIRPMINFMYGA
jgi:hypothetical protein